MNLFRWGVMIFLYSFTTIDARELPTISFQHDGLPNIESWATLKGTIPDLTTFTVCAYVKIRRARSSINTFISYAISENFNEIMIGFQFPSGRFSAYWDLDLLSEAPASVKLYKWTRFCYIQDHLNDKFYFWWDGKYVEGSTIFKVEKIRGGGIFTLGQDQDKLNGAYNVDQSFQAIVADFRFYDIPITSLQAKQFMHCHDFENMISQPIVDFFDIKADWILNGSTVIGSETTDNICGSEELTRVFYPEKIVFPEAEYFCNLTKGLLAIPTNEAENSKLLSLSMQYADVCRDGNGLITWLGARVNTEEKTFYNNYNGSPLIYHPNESERFPQGINCTAMNTIAPMEGRWGLKNCFLESLCYCCQHENITYVTVRGLCSRSNFDVTYLLHGHFNRKAMLKGFFYSDLYWNKDHWKLEYLKNKRITASMITTTSEKYPFGKNKWIIENDKCAMEDAKPQYLVLTTCKTGEFTCDNGYCVRIEQRCNRVPDCPDMSDEIECDLIKVDHTFVKMFSPPSLNKPNLKVSVNLTVRSIRSISLIDLALSFDLIITLTWKDSRLTFAHLKDDIDDNQVSEKNAQEIWTPGFFLENESGSKATVLDSEKIMYIQKLSQPKPDDDTQLKEDQLFLGKDNILQQQINIAIKLQCQFELGMYPFDSQRCKLILRSKDGVGFVTFEAAEPQFSNDKGLLEYKVGGVSAYETVVNLFSEVHLVITFHNLYKYYIFGTYLPTSLIVIITYLTFYFPLDDFTDRIMVSLTALMVLSTLFLQTTQGVAQTSYMKVIDVWFISCMLFNFVIIVTLTFLNFYWENNNFTKKVSPIANKFSVSHFSTSTRSDIKRWNFYMQIIFPIALLSYISGYVGYIAISNDN